MANHSKPSLFHPILCLLFLAAILTPLAVSVLQNNDKVSLMEKRKLEQMPPTPTGTRELKKYPGKLESYYADNFGFRGKLIRNFRRIKAALGDSPSPDVTIGKDGWLFLGSIKPGYSKYHDPIGDARHVNLYTDRELLRAANHFSVIEHWLGERGVEYMLVIAPNKHTIYFDKLPDYIKKENEYSATDQLIEYLRANTTITVVDLRPALSAQREKAPLYYKLDTHWNYFGANVAQEAIMKEVESLFPSRIQPRLFDMTETRVKAKDLGIQVGRGSLTEPDYVPVFNDTCDPVRIPRKTRLRDPHSYECQGQDLNAVIFRDSFFTALQPYFVRSFGRSTYVWERLKYDSLAYYVQRERPDLLIEQIVERGLPYVPAKSQSLNQSLNRERFEASNTTLFSGELSTLTFNSQLEAEGAADDHVALLSTGRNPAIRLPPLGLEPGRDYVLHLRFQSSVDSTASILFCEKEQVRDGCFSSNLSESIAVQKGKNDIYIDFGHPNIGSRVRLDPINKPGRVHLYELEIREVASI